MLKVLAMSSAPAANARSQRGNLVRSAAANPPPVTMPMRAHIDWTAAINGQVRSAVQSSAVPNSAPATE